MKQIRNKTGQPYRTTKEEGVAMPTVESVHYEMAGYLRDLEQYIKAYKDLPQHEAKTQAKKNLVDAGIIDENGQLTGFYKN